MPSPVWFFFLSPAREREPAARTCGGRREGGGCVAVRGGWRRRCRRHRLPLAAHQDGGGRAAELAERGGSLAGGRLLLRLQDDPLRHLRGIN